MITIHKYPLEIVDEQQILLPRGYEILNVIEQNGIPVIYAKVDTQETKTKDVWIRIFGTGHPIDSDLYNYLGTISTKGGDLIWHIFTF